VAYDVTAGRGLDDNYRGLGWQARYNWSADPDAPRVPHVDTQTKAAKRRAKLNGAPPEPRRTGLLPEVVDAPRPRVRLPTPVFHEERAAKYTPETSYRHFVEGRQVHLAQVARDPRMWPESYRRLPTPTATQPKMPPDTLVARMSDGTHDGDTSVPLVEFLQREHLRERRRMYPTSMAGNTAVIPPRRVRLTTEGTMRSDNGTYSFMTFATWANVAERRRIYPTPIASDAAISVNEVTLQKVENGEAFDQLARRVRHEQMEEAGIWEENPLAVRGEGEATVGRRARVRLPTPTSLNGLRGSSGSEHRPGAWQSPGHPEFGDLSPEWVEWIMGWPIGWTSPDPLPRAALEAWHEGNAARPDGSIPWWDFDPTEVSLLPDGVRAADLTRDQLAALPRAMSKTVPRGTPAQEDARRLRIAALGNGQVPAAMAAATLQVSAWEPPEGEDE
jgi:hypothetical protein